MAAAAPAPLVNPAAEEGGGEDLERGENNSDSDLSDLDRYSYYAVYVVSLAVLGIGVLAILAPAKSRIIAKTISIASTACGAFLLLNADLLVSWLRLRREVRKMAANNENFEAALKEQRLQVRRLEEAKSVLTNLDKKFGGSLEEAQASIDGLKRNARDNIRSSVPMLALIETGKATIEAEAMDASLFSLCNMYVRAYPDMHARGEEVKKGLQASAAYEREKSLHSNRLGKIFEEAIFLNVSDIRALTQEIAGATEDEFQQMLDRAG